MAYRAPSTRLADTTPAERRSGIVFSAILAFVFLAVAFPEMPPQALWGILGAGIGSLMLLFPPETRLPKLWLIAAGGFLLLAAAGFLPKEWVNIPAWRSEVENLGAAAGSRAYVQPLLAAEGYAGFAVTALAGLFLLGHRVSTALHHRLAIAFAFGVGLWTVAALIAWEPPRFLGFFPNRNHTACLLAMGTMAGTGALAQAIRLREPWRIALAAAPLPLLWYALVVCSVSRAGIVLVAVGTVTWLAATGFRPLKGHAGKAIILLLVAFAGMFAVVDSKVKQRLTETVEKVQGESDEGLSISADGDSSQSLADRAANFDARVTIFQDTVQMILHEPWTGVGPGQFVRVFPQHRDRTAASHEAEALHPESDWSMMAAESGVPAAACLGIGVIAVFAFAFRDAWQGRARLLRMGTLVAAGLLCFHGIFDVPGHRIGLAWAGALLLAISLRPTGDSFDPRKSRTARWLWRATACIPLVAGILLLQAQWTGNPLLPSARRAAAMQEAQRLYQADQAAYDQATAQGQEYDPAPADDPLLGAIAKVEESLRISPLDPHLHRVLAELALHYDDKREIAERSQALQLRLEPRKVSVVLAQAKAWCEQDPALAALRWDEALKRAALNAAEYPQEYFTPVNTFQRILRDAGWEDPFPALTARVASRHPALLEQWAAAAPWAIFDRELAALARLAPDEKTRRELQSIHDRRRPPAPPLKPASPPASSAQPRDKS